MAEPRRRPRPLRPIAQDADQVDLTALVRKRDVNAIVDDVDIDRPTATSTR
jgi:hypothetical protein